MQIQVGQTVYLEPTAYAAHRNKDIVETVVTKVGRKYFEVKNRRERFNLEKMCEITCYTPSWHIYLSKKEIEDKNEKETLISRLRKLFQNYNNINLSLEQLREIQKITKQNNAEGTIQ